MNAPGFSSRALAGGYDLDPDLPVPEPDWNGVEAGLHTLRHLSRFLASLGLELVLTGDDDSELWWDLSSAYDERVQRAEYRRYRKVTSPSGIRRMLRHEPRTVPLLWMSGSSCVGWSDISWDGVRLERFLLPGRLFALLPRRVSMMMSANQPFELHLMAWQPSFPTHSLVTWGVDGVLRNGPQELETYVRASAGQMFREGTALGHGFRRAWR